MTSTQQQDDSETLSSLNRQRLRFNDFRNIVIQAIKEKEEYKKKYEMSIIDINKLKESKSFLESKLISYETTIIDIKTDYENEKNFIKDNFDNKYESLNERINEIKKSENKKIDQLANLRLKLIECKNLLKNEKLNTSKLNATIENQNTQLITLEQCINLCKNIAITTKKDINHFKQSRMYHNIYTIHI